MKFAISILALLLLCSLPASAQVAGGSITGTVTGESGGAMPDVHVTVRDVGTGLARNATTNPAGLFNVPDLSPGNFEMTVSAYWIRHASLDSHNSHRGSGTRSERRDARGES